MVTDSRSSEVCHFGSLSVPLASAFSEPTKRAEAPNRVTDYASLELRHFGTLSLLQSHGTKAAILGD